MARRSQRLERAGNTASATLSSRSSPRGTKRKISYKEKSSDSSDGGGSDVGDNVSLTLSNEKAAKKLAVPKKSKLTINGANRNAVNQNGPAQSVPKLSSNQNDALACFSVSEMALWVRIIFHASQLLVAMAHSTGMSSTKWLLGMALVCKRLSGPALEILYYEVPLLSPRRWALFARTLDLDPETTWIKYRAKVKYFEFDLPWAHMPFPFSRVLRHTPQLRGIGKRDWHLAWYDNDFLRIRQFPKLFRSLLDSGVSLQSWTWNFTPTRDNIIYPWCTFANIQRKDIFKQLSTMTLAHYSGVPEPLILSSALRALPHLKNLVIAFPHPAALDADFWPALPGTLESLSLCNTWINAKELISFLEAKGFKLRELSLLHNLHLSIAFTDNLATVCPRLVTLHLDAQTWTGGVTRDSFTEALKDKFPSWPTTLQELKLVNVTNLDHKFAQTFFQTLLDASPRLKDLRTLIIKVGVNIPHRERADFRHSWCEKLEAVYLRHCPDPNPEIHSIAATEVSPFKSTNKIVPVPAISPRRSTRNTITTADSVVYGSKLAVQPRCNIVDIRVDNLRPSRIGRLFTEEDFLNPEDSGGSEWDGN